MALSKYRLGDLLHFEDERNKEMKYSLYDVKGISIQKKFIETKANMEDVSLSPYILVKPDFFAYVTVTSRNGDKITIAHNTSRETYIVSSSYVVFSVKRPDLINSHYLFMFFNRPEFDRYSRYNSWGSARETFSWEDLCDTVIELPSLIIQNKYVDVYNSMLINQKSYEEGLDDLKKCTDALLDKVKKESPKKMVGKFLTEVDCRNVDGIVKEVKGINIEKKFMPSVADSLGLDIKKYKMVKKNQFAYSGMQTGRDECIRIALNKSNNPIIISPAYSVLETYNTEVLPEFIMMWFSRKESDRRGWFMSDGSIRSNLDLDRFFETEIPVPSIEIQKALVDIYNALSVRRELNAGLKGQIKDICPILIKGSIEEARREA